MEFTQKDYIAKGVVIRPPTGIEMNYKFILPPYVSLPKRSLIYKQHYYHTFNELREAYPSPDKVSHCEGIIHSPCTINDNTSLKRARKKSWRLREEEDAHNTLDKDTNISDEIVPRYVSKKRRVGPTMDGNLETNIPDTPIGDNAVANESKLDHTGNISVLEANKLNYSTSEATSELELTCNYPHCSIQDKNLRLHNCQHIHCNNYIHHICADAAGSPEGHYFCSLTCLLNDIEVQEQVGSEIQEKAVAEANTNINLCNSKYKNTLESDYEEELSQSDEQGERDVFSDDDEESNSDLTIIDNNVPSISDILLDERLKEFITAKHLKQLHFRDEPPFSFPELFGSKATISNRSILDAKEPIHVFLQLFPIELIEQIVYHSNMYKNRSSGNDIRNFDGDEMLTFFGLLVAHAVLPWSSGVRQNWRTTTASPFPIGQWGTFMSRQRYEQISKFLHFNDNNNPNREDKFYKIRIVIEALNHTFQKAYTLGTHCAFDEGTWATKSRYCPAKQYNPFKPHKWGLKLFMLCCSETGFCSKFELYQGKTQNKVDSSNSAGPDALLRNVQHLAGSKRVIYCDRYYTTLSLFARLLYLGLYAVGTVKKTACGFPKDFSINSNSPRGSVKALQTNILNYGHIAAICWKDTKVVNMLSTAYPPVSSTITRRSKKGSKENFNSVLPVNMYQSGMGGVDLNDFLRMAIYSIQSHVRFRKWYKMCFSAALDMAVTNAYILWKIATRGSLSHGSFMETLSIQLLNFRISTISKQIRTRETNTTHEFCKYQSGEGYNGQYRNQKNCFVCKRTSSYYCKTCQVTICLKISIDYGMTCFAYIHADNGIQEKIQRRLQRLERINNSKSEREKRREERNDMEKRRKREFYSLPPSAKKKRRVST